jgi:hypothetical protein
MPLVAELSELEEKHQELERELADEMSHPLADSLRVAELKRRKLVVKDQMMRLQDSVVATVH